MGLEGFAVNEIISESLNFSKIDFAKTLADIHQNPCLNLDDIAMQLEESMSELYEQSYLKGQFVTIYIHDKDVATGALHIEKSTPNNLIELDGMMIQGTIDGYYVQTEIISSNNVEDSRIMYIEPGEFNEFKGITLNDYDEVRFSLGIKVAPFDTSEDASEDNDIHGSIYEIPCNTIEEIIIPDSNHPFLVEESMYYEIQNLIKINDQFIYSQEVSENILKEHVEKINQYSRLIGKTMLLLFERDVEPSVIKVGDVAHVIDLSVLEKEKGTFLGYELMDTEYSNDKLLHANFAPQFSHKDEIIQVPVSDIVAGYICEETPTPKDQKLFNTVVEHFYTIVENIILNNPYAYEEIIEIVSEYFDDLNKGIALTDDSRSLKLKIHSDAVYRFVDVEYEDGNISINAPENPKVIRPGSEYWLECEVLYYYFNYCIVEDEPMDVEDFYIMAVIDPKNLPQGLFESNALAVQLSDIINSQFARENYN